MVAVFISLPVCFLSPNPVSAQEVILEECYGGVQVTSFAVYDPETGQYLEKLGPDACLGGGKRRFCLLDGFF